MTLATNAVASKAKTMYGDRITSEMYEELLKKHTLQEVTTYLKNETSYRDALADVKDTDIHRGELEQLLRKELYHRLEKLNRYVGTKGMEFYHYYQVQDERQLIMVKFRMLSSKMFEQYDRSYIPSITNYRCSFEVQSLMSAKSIDEVMSVISHSIYHKPLKKYFETTQGVFEYNSCDRLLTKVFYDWLFRTIDRHFKGKTRQELKTIFNCDLELSNITQIYRYKKFYNLSTEEILSSLYLENSRMSKNFMTLLAQAKDEKELLSLLARSKYHQLVDSKDYIFIEYYSDCMKFNLAKRYMRFSSNAALVYTTYFIVCNREIENIINIVEGVRYGVPSDNIAKMLIY